MRLTRLSTAALVLIWYYGVAAAQQSVLVPKDERDDPCGRFRMRVLVPAEDENNYKLRVQQPSADIDPQIVWNPCLRNESEVARLVIPPSQDYGKKFFALPPGWTPAAPFMLTEQSDRLKNITPQMPPAMEMMRGRKR